MSEFLKQESNIGTDEVEVTGTDFNSVGNADTTYLDLNDSKKFIETLSQLSDALNSTITDDKMNDEKVKSVISNANEDIQQLVIENLNGFDANFDEFNKEFLIKFYGEEGTDARAYIDNITAQIALAQPKEDSIGKKFFGFVADATGLLSADKHNIYKGRK